MTRSEFFRLDRVYDNVAEGCDPIRDEGGNLVGWKKNIYSFPPIGTPDGGAYVTAGDLVRFLAAVKDGTLLLDELAHAFLTPQVHYREMNGWTKMFLSNPHLLRNTTLAVRIWAIDCGRAQVWVCAP